MVRSKYIYWCTRHQQHVATSVRRRLKVELDCQIVKLNLTLLQQLDFHKLSTWIDWTSTKEWSDQINQVLNQAADNSEPHVPPYALARKWTEMSN